MNVGWSRNVYLSSLFLLHIAAQFPQHCLLLRLSFPIIFCLLYHRLITQINMDLLLFHSSVSFFCAT